MLTPNASYCIQFSTFCFLKLSCISWRSFVMNCVSPQFISWSPKPRTLECDIFGARVFTEMVKVKWGHMGGFESRGMCVLTRRDQDTDLQRGKTLWRHGEKVDVYTPRREASDISISVDNLVLNFQPLLCKRPSKLLQDPLKVGWLGLDERNLV